MFFIKVPKCSISARDTVFSIFSIFSTLKFNSFRFLPVPASFGLTRPDSEKNRVRPPVFSKLLFTKKKKKKRMFPPGKKEIFRSMREDLKQTLILTGKNRKKIKVLTITKECSS